MQCASLVNFLGGLGGSIDAQFQSLLLLSQFRCFAIYQQLTVKFYPAHGVSMWVAIFRGKVIGIIGCGHIGKDLIRLLKAFDCDIIVNDIKDQSAYYAQNNITSKSLHDLLRQADVVTLHVPLDASTRYILNSDNLALLKPTAILINTARGELVDEVTLKDMLSNGRLAGAAFDVFAMEPPNNHGLLSLTNFLATPHIGGSAYEAILAMGRSAIDGLDINAIPAVIQKDG